MIALRVMHDDGYTGRMAEKESESTAIQRVAYGANVFWTCSSLDPVKYTLISPNYLLFLYT